LSDFDIGFLFIALEQWPLSSSRSIETIEGQITTQYQKEKRGGNAHRQKLDVSDDNNEIPGCCHFVHPQEFGLPRLGKSGRDRIRVSCEVE
jgi:hypothetical protein